MEVDATNGNDGHIYRHTKFDEIQEILIAARDKRNKLSIKYNRGVNIIVVIDYCLDVTAIGLGITGVSLLSTIVAAPALIEMEAVSIVMGLLRVVGISTFVGLVRISFRKLYLGFLSFLVSSRSGSEEMVVILIVSGSNHLLTNTSTSSDLL